MTNHSLSLTVCRPSDVATIYYGLGETPFGKCLIASTATGICHLSFTDDTNQNLLEVQKLWAKADFTQDHLMAKNNISKIFSASEHSFQLVVQGTDFQIKALKALLSIPRGKVVTYKELANLIGHPKAIRAAGSACARNEISYLIPCHRVIASSGKVHRYRWGEERKKAILDFEQAIVISKA